MVERVRTGDCRNCKYLVWLISILVWWNRTEQDTVEFVSVLIANKTIVVVEQDRPSDCKFCDYFVWMINILLWWKRTEQATVGVVSILDG
jgi:hypothetical protein